MVKPFHVQINENACLVIVPDGFLVDLPFAPFMFADTKYLVEKHPILIVPSLKMLQLLGKRKIEFSKESRITGDLQSISRQLPIAREEAFKVG